MDSRQQTALKMEDFKASFGGQLYGERSCRDFISGKNVHEQCISRQNAIYTKSPKW